LTFRAKMYNHMVVNRMNLTLTALADPTRRAILDRLALGPASVNEIARPFKMTQQAVSKHLEYLHRAQLINKRRDGRQQFCTLNPQPFREVIGWAEQCCRFWEESFERLDGVLEGMKRKEKKK
jgi:DNA-binding transcriptional ArsR family regulator